MTPHPPAAEAARRAPATDGPQAVPAKRVHLHVGMHKTGSTWIQKTLQANRARLAARGIGYPDMGESHGWPLIHILAPRRGARRPRRERSPAAVARYRQALREALEDPRLADVVLSGEQLSSRLSEPETAALAALTGAPGVEVRVIAYVREPVAFTASMTLQRLKAGATPAELAARPPLPAYRARLRKFIRVFGRENVEIRIHDPARLRDGDVLADFLEAIGRPGLEAELALPGYVARNRAMSARAARWLGARNRLFALIWRDPARRPPPRLARLLERLPGPPFALPEETAARLRAETAADRRWLRRMLGEAPFAPPRKRRSRKDA